MKVKPAFGWAWAMASTGIKYNRALWKWTSPYRSLLVLGYKPSPEAKAVAVAILPRAEYRELKRKARLFDALQKGGPHAK